MAHTMLHLFPNESKLFIEIYGFRYKSVVSYEFAEAWARQGKDIQLISCTGSLTWEFGQTPLTNQDAQTRNNISQNWRTALYTHIFFWQNDT